MRQQSRCARWELQREAEIEHAPVNAHRQLRSITVFLAVLASTIPLRAQTTTQFPKATGVGNAVVQRAMTNLHPLATFRVGGNPDWMALTADSVWVTSSSTNSVIRLNTATNQVGESVTVAKPCSGLAIGFGSLWVPSCADHSLVRVDLETRKVVARIPAGPANAEGGITTGAGSVWMVTSPRGMLARIDPTNNRVVARIRIPPNSYAATFADGWVWITSTGKSLLSRVDPATNKLVSITSVGRSPRFLTVGAGSVWTLNQGDGTISRVDTKTGKLSAVIEAGLSGPGGEIAYGEGCVWATLSGFPITRIDPATNKVTQQWTGKGGDSIRVGFGSVWLTDLDAGVVWRIDPALR
jgi:virginiamycin B lyase